MDKMNFKKWQQPFIFLNGSTTIWIGVVFMLLGAMLSNYILFRYDGLIDYHQTTNFKFIYYFDQIIAWALLSFVSIIVGRLFKRSFRWIDIFGMYALAMAPLFLFPLFTLITGMNDVIIPTNGEATIGEILGTINNHQVQLLIYSILQIGVIVWFIYWAYQVFKLNLNIKKINDKLLFAIVIIVVEILSILILRSY